MSEKVPALIQPPEGYADWLADLKVPIHVAQQRAAHGHPSCFVDCEARGSSPVNGVLTEFGAVHYDTRELMRTAEPRYRELGLASASAEQLIEAMTGYPELIQRPVIIWADRAVVARPPELLLPLLATRRDQASS